MYGYDGGKQVKGRKRHLLVDTLGLVIGVIVSEANMPERLGAVAVLLELEANALTQTPLKNLALIWVDAGYTGANFARVVQQLTGAQVEVVKRSSSEFEILPRRWVVERTFGWLCQNRRLVVDYELLPETSTSMIYLAMIRLMLRRLTA